MLNFVMSAAFQNVQITNQIRISIGMRVFQRITHACLRCQMDHAIKLLSSENLRHAFAIGEIGFVKAEQGGLQEIQARLLEIDIVVIVHVVDAHNLMTRLQKALACMKADKSCGSSD
jgi:hypothetical protein